MVLGVKQAEARQVKNGNNAVIRILVPDFC
jgi:hypothetical protein